MTVKLSVWHAWGNPTLTLSSAGLTALIARVSVSPLCARGWLSFQRATPPLSPSCFLPPRDLWGKNGRAEDLSSQWQASPRRLNARVPRRHRRESICRSSSLSMISVPRQLRATGSCSVGVTARWMTAFLWQRRMRRSYRALWLTPPSCSHPLHSMPDSERKRSSSVSWQRLSQKSHLAAGWMSGFSRGAIKPPANAHPPSSPKSTMSSLNRSMPPTRLVSVHLPPLPSPQLPALKRRDTSACPLSMSLWPCISASATVSAERATAIQRHAASFKEVTAGPLKAFQKMLGHMAVASPVLQCFACDPSSSG